MKITDFITGKVQYDEEYGTILWGQTDHQYLHLGIGSKYNNEYEIGNWIAAAINEKLEREKLERDGNK